MGSISNSLNGLSILNQSGSGLLSNLPVQLSTSTLQSAAPQDVASLSSAALQLQQVDGIFGISPPAQTAVDTTAPIAATNGQQAAAAGTSMAQQEIQALFYPLIGQTNTFSLTG